MKRTVTNTYPISFLVRHPQTRGLMLKHLSPILTEEELLANQQSLDGMFPVTLASGNRFIVIQILKKELNTLELPLRAVIESNDGRFYEVSSDMDVSAQSSLEWMLENLHYTPHKKQ